MVPISVLLLLPSPGRAATTACITPNEALRYLNKEVCVAAHVYTVVQAAKDTRFLDVCSPQTSDADCHFTIVSFPQDRTDVGDLAPLAGQDIQVRGAVRSFEGRAEIVLERRAQLHGGRGKFHPNPLLLQGFSAEYGEQAFRHQNGVAGQRGVHFHHKGR